MTDALAIELLPKQSSTPYEAANLGAMIEAWPLDIDAIRRESDPMLCAADKLSFLAFDRGLTLWSDAWPEAKKRSYVRDAWIYKRLEGTPLGVEAYLNLADGALIAEVLPPADSFLVDDDGLTHQQIEDLMPQLRLYHYWPEIDASPGALFLDAGCFDGPAALVPDQTGVLGRYPVLYDPQTGLETPLDINDVSETAVTVSLTGQSYAGGGFFLDAGFLDQGLFGDAFVPMPIIFDLADPAMETLRISPPLRAVQAAFDTKFFDATYWTPDLGDEGTYDRLYVYDPSRIPSGTNGARAAMFLDSSWFGLLPYLELLTAAVPGDPLPALPQSWQFWDAGFLFDADDHPQLDFALDAIRLAKRGGDRVLIELDPTFAGTRAATLPAMQDI